MLSEKEQKLLEFIKNNKVDVTTELIEKNLGKEYIGAISRLIRNELIEIDKKKVSESTNPYGWKYVKCYFIKKKENNDN